MNRELNIDILRILSILVVVASHYQLIIPSVYLNGTHGVVLFFFISGYCILLTGYKKSGFLEFWKARYLRLLPVLILAATLIAVLKRIFKNAHPERLGSISDYFFTLVCTPTFDFPCMAVSLILDTPEYSFVDGSFWSLLVEFRFYLLFSIIWYVLNLKKYCIFILQGLSYICLYTQIFFDNRINDFFLYLTFFSFGMSFFEYSHKSKKIGFWGMIFSLTSYLVFSWIEVQHISFKLTNTNYFSYLICFFIFLTLMMFLKNNLSSNEKLLKYVAYSAILTYPIYLLHQDLGYILLKFGFNQGLPSIANGIFVLVCITLLSHYTHKISIKIVSLYRKVIPYVSR